MAVLPALTDYLTGSNIPEGQNFAGSPYLHRNNIENEFKRKYGRLPTIQEREQLAGFSGDMGQIGSLLNGSSNPYDVPRNIAMSPQREQQRGQLVNAIYDPQEQRVKNSFNDSYKQAEGSYLQQQSNLGLLRSGGTDGGLSNINRDRASGQAEQLAQLALQRSGLSQQMLGQELDLAGQQRSQGFEAEQMGFNKTKAAQELLDSPFLDQIPDNLLKQLLEAYGFIVE